MEEVSLRAVLSGSPPAVINGSAAASESHTEEVTWRLKGGEVLAFESCGEDRLVRMSPLTLEKHSYSVVTSHS